tara:strand:- start:739 stop:2040 length:1302 start_codon:yes stop_codon:yes gene_type:complete
MIQIVVEHISDNSFLTINDMVDHKTSEYSRIEVDRSWQQKNHSSWNKKFYDGRHFKLITLDEYDPDIPAFYLVTLNHCVDRFNSTWVNFLRKDTVRFLKANNIPIILSQPIEHTYDFISESHGENRLSRSLDNLDILLCGRELYTNDILIHGISKIHRKPWTLNGRRLTDVFSYHFLDEAKDFDRYGKSTKFQDHVDNFHLKSKKFICLNRVPRELRTLSLLKNREFLSDSYYTFLGEEPPWRQMSTHELNIRFEESCRIQQDLEVLLKHKNEVLPLIPMTLPDDEVSNQRENNILNQYRKEVWYEVVMETHDLAFHKIPMSILSEKITWPILNHLPFITVGHRMNTQFLQYLGFKTFDDLFFKTAEFRHTGTNVSELLECIHETIKDYNSKCNAENFMEIKDRLEFNYNHLLQTDWTEIEKNNFLNPWGFHN